MVIRVYRHERHEHVPQCDVLAERGIRVAEVCAYRSRWNRRFRRAAVAFVVCGAFGLTLVSLEMVSIERREDIIRVERIINRWPMTRS